MATRKVTVTLDEVRSQQRVVTTDPEDLRRLDRTLQLVTVWPGMGPNHEAKPERRESANAGRPVVRR